MQRSSFIEGHREEKQEGAPVLSAAAPGSKLERENQGASLRSPGQCQALVPEETPYGEGSREDTVRSQEGEEGGRGCEKEKPGRGREDEKGTRWAVRWVSVRK